MDGTYLFFAADEVAIVHVMNRAVRRCFLYGEDSRPEDRSGYSVRHLAPVELKERGGDTGPCVHKAGARCSNKGFLLMSAAEYLQLLDWTARQVRSDKAGATPKQFAPLFE